MSFEYIPGGPGGIEGDPGAIAGDPGGTLGCTMTEGGSVGVWIRIK